MAHRANTEKLQGHRPDNIDSDELIHDAIGLTHGPYIDRGASSRVATSQPQAFVFDANNCGVRGLSEGTVGRKKAGEIREKHTTRREAYAESRAPNLRMQATR